MSYLSPSHDPALVVASVLIATFASYVTLNLAGRMGTSAGRAGRVWWAVGSLAMGTGIWAMHFVGMLAFSLPIALGYTKVLTLVSWLAAVGVSAVALLIASGGSLTMLRLAAGSLAMGAGICAMHYIGMAALDLLPAIVWDGWRVAASALVAVAASAAALVIFFWLRKLGHAQGHRAHYFKLAAAVAMGLAISGMHYTGMSAASFPEGSVCFSANSLSGSKLGIFVILAAVSLLALTLFTSVLDAHMQGRAAQFAATLAATNTQLQQANDALHQQAFRDPLTSLPNRLLFEDRLAQATARAERGTGNLAVLFIDLDGFKPVNDSFGHAAGDAVLKEAAVRLRGSAREGDTVARVGGDEFLLLMENVASVPDAEMLARRLLSALVRPFDIAGRRVEISGSIGVVLYPAQGEPGKLVANADAAMYAAKRSGGNTFALFEPHMDSRAAEQLNLHNDLRNALALGQLALHYQPKIDGRNGEVSSIEALLRWMHPQRGLVEPDVFIPLAERFGLIHAIGNWVIDEACRQVSAWAADGLQMRVAVNLSVHQLREADLVDRIAAALERHNVAPMQLLCEITESVAMEDIGLTKMAFEGLSRIGVFLSIDDFGTGYSSLSYLRKLPARQLKIDGSFVRDLETSADARAIVKAVISLAHALSLEVVAEGVETEGQRDILLGMQCDELQGFLFARPMPADQLPGWTARHRAAAHIGLHATVHATDQAGA